MINLVTSGHIELFSARELSRIREHTSRAVATSIEKLAEQRRYVLPTNFVGVLHKNDVVITTNWDLLLDRALHSRFEIPSEAVGSAVIVTDDSCEPIARQNGPLRRPPFCTVP